MVWPKLSQLKSATHVQNRLESREPGGGNHSWEEIKTVNVCWALLLPSGFSHVCLCDPMDCRPLGSSVHGDSQGKNTGVGCHALLQGIFLTQGLNPGLLHYRQILYHWANREARWACDVFSYSILYNNFMRWALSLPHLIDKETEAYRVKQLLVYWWC